MGALSLWRERIIAVAVLIVVWPGCRVSSPLSASFHPAALLQLRRDRLERLLSFEAMPGGYWGLGQGSHSRGGGGGGGGIEEMSAAPVSPSWPPAAGSLM